MEQVHILLADDDIDDVFLFRKALERINIPTRLTVAEDGEKLMNYLQNNNKDLPDVIFLDLNMPRKTGNICLTEIKGEEKLKQIPVVIYSTSLHREVADLLYEKGATYYLQKCDFFELSKNIQKVLSLVMSTPSQPPKEQFVVNGRVLV